MPKPFKLGKINVGLTAGSEPTWEAPHSDQPFCIALLGDFSGRGNRRLVGAADEQAGRRPLQVDRDNVDQVLAKLGAELHVPIGDAGTRIPMRFAELEDFHPDRLFQRLGLFGALRDLRNRLSQSSTHAAAAAEVREWLKKPAASPATPAPPPSTVNPENLLEQILGEMPVQTPERTRLPGGGDWQSLLQKIVKPHVAPSLAPDQAELQAVVDEATSEQMRAILHHPDFQALEAVWRGVHLLIRRLETDTKLRLFLVDISKDELIADFNAAEDLTATALYRLLVEQSIGTPGGQPWAVLAGAYTFGQGREDVELLADIGAIARQAGAPFLAAADPRILGCASLAATPDPRHWKPDADAEGNERWQALRSLPQAASLGLALPRFLARQPYGNDTEPCERFRFEEMPPGSSHESYLWANPAFACIYLLGRGFERLGWALDPGHMRELDGLPAHVYRDDGESYLKPCAEVLLTDRATAAILNKGLMPLLSVQGADSARLAQFQSLAEPSRPLAARWG